MLQADELKQLKQSITNSSRPLIFFDDDADGLASYLLCRKTNSDAIGLRAARGPELTHHFIGFVNRYSPDQVLILDKPMVSEQFSQTVRTPTLWLDHHDAQAYQKHAHHSHITYLNPSVHDPSDHRPTSYWIQQAINGPLWIACAGVTSDWDDSYLELFAQTYPDLAPKELTIPQALYNSELGRIIRILNFCLKGTTRQINDCVEALTHIQSPHELLEAKTHAANHIHRHVKPILSEYERQLSLAKNGEKHNNVYTYIFDDVDTSLVTNVANELMTQIQTDVLLIGRKEQDRINFSMRSTTIPIDQKLQEALQGIDGYGGGHEYACGGSIAQKDWKEFLERITTN